MDILLIKVLWFFEILVKSLWNVAANTVVIDSNQFKVKKLVIDEVHGVHVREGMPEDEHDPDPKQGGSQPPETPFT